ncbi:MAG: cell division protein FtsQ/DivIB [Candidatus Bruticola sp.]
MSVKQEREQTVSSINLPSNYSVRQIPKVILVIFFCLAQSVFLLSPVFKISQIRVDGNAIFSSDEIINQSPYKVGLYYWASLFTCGTCPLDDPAILESDVSLESRGSVVISVKERIPMFLVCSENYSGYWLMADSNGCILGKERPGYSRLPRFKVDFGMPQLEMNNFLIKNLLRLVPQIEKALNVRPVYYSVDSMQNISACINFLGHDTVIKLGTPDRLNIKLEIVQALLNQFQLKKKKIDSIDVRFSSVFIKEYEAPYKFPDLKQRPSKKSTSDQALDKTAEDIQAAETTTDSVGSVNDTDGSVSNQGDVEENSEAPAAETPADNSNEAAVYAEGSADSPPADTGTEDSSAEADYSDSDLHVNGGGAGEAISVP